MRNTDFYQFCKQGRKTEQDARKKVALDAVYRYMWECGVSKSGVTQFIATQKSRAQSEESQAVYDWLLDVFNAPGQLSEDRGRRGESEPKFHHLEKPWLPIQPGEEF